VRASGARRLRGASLRLHVCVAVASATSLRSMLYTIVTNIYCHRRSQHMFIDAGAPRDSYRMTYNCINAADNQKSFNDGCA